MTETDIANRALALIGQPSISSIHEGTGAARSIAVHFEVIRDALLRSHPWDFATVRVELSRDSEQPAFGWQYQFPLPDDFLRLKTFNEVDSDLCRSSFDIESGVLLTNSTSALVSYVQRIKDPSRFDSLFADVFAHQLAAAVCIDITGNESLSRELSKDAQRKLKGARFVDSSTGGRRSANPISAGGFGRQSRPMNGDYDHVRTVIGPTGEKGERGERGLTGDPGPPVADGIKGDITVSGAGLVWNINGTGAENVKTILALGSAAQSAASDFAAAAHSHDANVITYSPAVEGDWIGSTDPGNTNGALDQLASRIKIEEDAPAPVLNIVPLGRWEGTNVGSLVADNIFDDAVYSHYSIIGQFLPATNNVNLIGVLRDVTPSDISATLAAGQTRARMTGAGVTNSDAVNRPDLIAAVDNSIGITSFAGQLLPYSGGADIKVDSVSYNSVQASTYHIAGSGKFSGYAETPKGIKFYFSTGNIAEGWIQIVGHKKQST